MLKEELIKEIVKDLENGKSYLAIRKERNLKSDYLIREARRCMGASLKGSKDFEYYSIKVNKSKINKLSNNELTSLYAFLSNANEILRNNEIFSMLYDIKIECIKRDRKGA